MKRSYIYNKVYFCGTVQGRMSVLNAEYQGNKEKTIDKLREMIEYLPAK